MPNDKVMDITTVKEFIKTLLPKYLPNKKEVLDKFTIDNNNILKFDGKSITKIDDEISSNIDAWSSNKIEEFVKNYVSNSNANFVSEEGYGNIRYYNGKFQSYNTKNNTWSDIETTINNTLVQNIIPKNMELCQARMVPKEKTIQLRFIPPSDTIVDGSTTCTIAGVKIYTKTGSPPTIKRTDSKTTLLIDIKREDFDKYNNKWFNDPLGEFENGKTYYYLFVPYVDINVYNASSANLVSKMYREDTVFEFTIDQTESDPSKMITYGEDNEFFTSAYMDYDKDEFDYGDWTVENGAWFMDVKPCMLKYDGTVDYYLDPNDYSKKADGTPSSDYNNTEYDGNVMIQIPKTYVKEILYEDNPDKVTYQFSNKKLDDDFKCWAHLDNNGNEIDYCYMSAYLACKNNDANKIKSVSGVSVIWSDLTGIQEIEYAKANNINDDNIWYTAVYCDRILLDKLLYLITKNANPPKFFMVTGGSANQNSFTTGSSDTNGLFYGISKNTISKAVPKVFGIERYYNYTTAIRIAGCVTVAEGVYAIKLTYSQADGSTVNGYNTTGDGYINTGIKFNTIQSNSPVKSMKFANQCILPSIKGGSNSTYYCTYAKISGGCYFEVYNGFAYTNIMLDRDVTYTYADYVATSLSCKPYAKV